MDNAVRTAGDPDSLVSTTGASPPTIETIVDAIASAMGLPPAEIPPLYETVDPSAIERLLATNAGGRVTFRYEGLRVTADADGTVAVYEV